MKTNIYILLILLLSFSFGNAQTTEFTAEVENNETIAVTNDVETVTLNDVTETNTVIENDSLFINANELRESIARGTSDIRIYLNRERKVSNISIVFPKINKAVKA